MGKDITPNPSACRLDNGGHVGWRGKRGMDIALTLLAAPLLLPLLAIVAVIVRVWIGSPVLFWQTRPGLGGRPFNLVKFRTMRDDRDDHGNLLPDGARLTSFGRFLRASSLDELPEFWNVLRGEMSIVGPRPLLVEYLPLYSPRQARRHEVRPGMTGLAQIKGRNRLSWARKFHYDVIYVERCGLALDLWVLAKTVLVILNRVGINEAGEATASPFRGNLSQADSEKAATPIKRPSAPTGRLKS